MFCLFCGGRLPLLRDLTLGEFCSPEHREQFERLEHEFQESDPGHAPARCSLIALRPAIPSSNPRLLLTPKQSCSGNTVVLPPDLNAAERLRNPAACPSVKINRVAAEPGYVGSMTPLNPCAPGATPQQAHFACLVSAISSAAPGPDSGIKLFRLKRKLSVHSSRPAPLARPPLWRTMPEPLIGAPHAEITDALPNIATAIPTPKLVASPKRHARMRLPNVRWRPLAIAAGLGAVAFLIIRTAQPSAHATERTPENATWARVKHDISNRAAINMVDDFRTGLDSWKGAPAGSGWSYDSVGFIKPSKLAVYDPSINLKDYTVEFLGQLRTKGIGIAVRAADLNNYYAVRLIVVHPGPLPISAIVRYAVIDGHEGPHVVKPLPLTIRPDTMFRGRILANGDEFTLMIQDQVVDLWSDDRLRRGGVGFFCERGDDARLRWVEITHHDDTLGRLCAMIAPYRVTGANGSWDQ